jgi:DSF synthase
MRVPINAATGDSRAETVFRSSDVLLRPGRAAGSPARQYSSDQQPSGLLERPAPSTGEPAQGDAATRLAERLRALDLRELELEYDPATRAVWGFQAHRERPGYTPRMLADIQSVQQALRVFYLEHPEDAGRAARFTVLASRTSGVFNLGGDLQHFVSCVEAGDEQALRDYAMASIDICYRNYQACNAGMVTTALACGDALGGGFEAALACDVIVAEEQARFALPEIHYGLFPGMGAYTFLSRRLGQARAERAILDSPAFTARELYDLGLVNAVCDNGKGIETMDRQLTWMLERFDAVFAVFEARRHAQPVSREEMEAIGETWVRLAMRLPETSLRRMKKLAQAQRLRLKRMGSG